MLRSLLAVAALALSAAPAALAPVPRDVARLPDFFPTQVGTKWVYEQDGFDHTEEIVQSETRGGRCVAETYFVTAYDPAAHGAGLTCQQPTASDVTS